MTFYKQASALVFNFRKLHLSEKVLVIWSAFLFVELGEGSVGATVVNIMFCCIDRVAFCVFV